MTRAHRLAGAALLLALSTGVVELVTASTASAQSCSAITISQGQGIDFDVSSVIVTSGACVRFANLTDVTVTVTVSGSSYSERLPARTPASASSSYIAHKSATVTATDGVRTGHGRIEVESASSQPTVAPTTSTYVPPPSGSAPSPAPVSTVGAYSVATAQPVQPVQTSGAVAVLPALPSLPHGDSSAPPAASHPVVAPRVKSSDPRYTSTVLEPAGRSGRGLPAAVAVVMLLGLASAYGRTVLIAAPAVDAAARGRRGRATV